MEHQTGPSGQDVEELSNVVYIGHLPHGFYEQELLGYFSQFGKLINVRLSRSKRTGKPKHYAFLQFQNKEVARIAADTMNGYFMFKQKLQCRVLRPTQIHPELFKGANRRFKQVPWRKLETQRHNKVRSPEEHASRVASLMQRDSKRKARIQAAGIDYEYDGLKTKVVPRAKKVKFDD